MKKVFLIVAVALMTGAFANAQVSNVNPQPVATVVAQDEYKEVKLEDLSPKAQETVKAYLVTYDVKAVTYNAAKKLAKVTLSAKADGTEKVVILNEEGQEVTE